MNIIHIFVFAVLAAVAVLLARIAVRLRESRHNEERQLDASAHTVARLISRRLHLSRLLGSSLLTVFAAAVLTACSGDDNIVGEPTPGNTDGGTSNYTLTIQATKATDATTRALALDDKTLNATWKTGETVDVYKVTTVGDEEVYTGVGTLTAQANGATATLSGTLTGDFAVNDQLVLFFNGGVLDYQGQTGTLDDIASNYDYATASGEVTGIDGSNLTVVDAATKSATVPFDNQQAIVKFTLKDKATGEPISMKSLKLHDAGNNIFTGADYLHNGSANMGDITVTRATAGSEFFVAIKTEEDYVGEDLVPRSLDLTLTAIGEGTTPDIYTYSKSGVKFTIGKYYEITVSMTKQTENVVNMKDVGYMLDNPSLAYTARTGDVLTGQAVKDLENEYTDRIAIDIADGATVTLRNVSIGDYGYSSEGHAGITCLGDATIILEGTNTVRSFDANHPGIYVPEGKTLTIQGSGSLTARGGSAGIGGGSSNCGNINITGGTIVATGSTLTAGIGSGSYATCGNISISGSGTSVTATGDWGAAGIGSGFNGACGNISITGGTVVATGGERAAGIGGGCFAKCSNITIASAVTSVTATKGNNSDNNSTPYSIGVGSDYSYYLDAASNITDCGTITFDTEAITPTWQKGDEDHKNAWIYTPTPTDGQTYGGLTLAIAGNTWTLTPVTP